MKINDPVMWDMDKVTTSIDYATEPTSCMLSSITDMLNEGWVLKTSFDLHGFGIQRYIITDRYPYECLKYSSLKFSYYNDEIFDDYYQAKLKSLQLQIEYLESRVNRKCLRNGKRIKKMKGRLKRDFEKLNDLKDELDIFIEENAHKLI